VTIKPIYVFVIILGRFTFRNAPRDAETVAGIATSKATFTSLLVKFLTLTWVNPPAMSTTSWDRRTVGTATSGGYHATMRIGVRIVP